MSVQRKVLIDRSSVLVFGVAWTMMTYQLAPVLLARDAWPMTGLGLVCGYLLADLLAGTVHWIADRFLERDTPFLGPLIPSWLTAAGNTFYLAHGDLLPVLCSLQVPLSSS